MIKNAFVLSAMMIGLSCVSFAAEPGTKQPIKRTLQTKTGQKIKTRTGQIIKVKQSGFHKSLG